MRTVLHLYVPPFRALFPGESPPHARLPHQHAHTHTCTPVSACIGAACALAGSPPHTEPPSPPCFPLFAHSARSKERAERIQELRWTHRSLPEHVKSNLSPLEQQYFRQGSLGSLGDGQLECPRHGNGLVGGASQAE